MTDDLNTIKDKEAYYGLLFDKAVDSIFLMKDDLFVDCNPATLKMFGCTREQIIQKTPYRYSPEYQPDGSLSQVSALEKITSAISGKSQFFEWRHLRYDGTPFDAEVTLRAIKLPGGHHILAIVRDISVRKSAEQELELSRKQLLAQNQSLKLITELSTQLHGSQSLQSIADKTLDALHGVTGTAYVAIFFIEGNDSLKLVASHGYDDEILSIGETIKLKDGLTGYAIKHEEIVFSENMITDDRLNNKMKEELSVRNIKSGIALPLIYQGSTFGCINLGYHEEDNFYEVKKETLYIISNIVSQSLANAFQIKDLDHVAHHDSLTGLPNRLFFHKYFLKKKKRLEQQDSALLLLDLDRFKEVNDTLGHYIGDLLLQEIGPRISALFEENDVLLSRLGGDEFIMLINNVSNQNKIMEMTTKVLECLRKPFEIDSTKLEIDVSIGIARYPQDGKDSHALLRSADVAMYEAKRKGGGIQNYDQNLDKHSPERLLLMTELNNGIRKNQLVLHYQPKIDLKTGKVNSLEALVRWQHPQMGLLYPDRFIPLAEMTDSIHNLTEAVLEIAIKQQQQWFSDGFEFSVSINLSARNLINDRCLVLLTKQIEKFQIQPGMLELEITETALMQEPEMANRMLHQIAALGVKLSIDDFGTGYSSLAYLRRMPINLLKIDREFVRDMLSNNQDAIIVNSTISLSHNLNLKVVAEGVEDEKTLNRLKKMGCDFAQGFYICKPKPWNEIQQWLDKKDS